MKYPPNKHLPNGQAMKAYVSQPLSLTLRYLHTELSILDMLKSFNNISVNVLQIYEIKNSSNSCYQDYFLGKLSSKSFESLLFSRQ